MDPNYGHLYHVSSDGKVFSKSTGYWVEKSFTKDYKGYLRGNFYRKSVRIHRLVAEVYVPRLEGKAEVNHKDGDKLNNSASNLEWCSNKESNEHSVLMGLTTKPKPVCGVAMDGSGVWFRSSKEAERFGFTGANIRACLRGRQHQSKGYFWYVP